MIGAVFSVLRLVSGRLFKWAVAHPRDMVIAVLLAVSALLAWKSHGWHGRYVGEHAAHKETVANYERAQKVAREMNAAQIAQRVAYYEKQSREKELEYEIALRDNHAAVDRWLRAQTVAGHTGGTGSGTAANMPGEALQGTGEAVIPETALIPIEDLYIVADTYAQCEQLRQWALSVGRL